jgi:drug/metabolite transporter (DMT)-like permease
LGGVVGAIGLAALYQGLALGPMSIVAPTASLSVTVPVAVGFLQGDRPSSAQWVGVVCAIGGIVLAARAPSGEDETRRFFSRGLIYALIAAVFLGALVTFLGAAGEASPGWAAFMVRVVSVPLLVIALLVTRDRGPKPTARQTGSLIVVGAMDNLANVTFAIASRSGLLSLVSVLASLYPVSTVLLARGFLHERLARHQWVGVITAFVGVALIAAG